MAGFVWWRRRAGRSLQPRYRSLSTLPACCAPMPSRSQPAGGPSGGTDSAGWLRAVVEGGGRSYAQEAVVIDYPHIEPIALRELREDGTAARRCRGRRRPEGRVRDGLGRPGARGDPPARAARRDDRAWRPGVERARALRCHRPRGPRLRGSARPRGGQHDAAGLGAGRRGSDRPVQQVRAPRGWLRAVRRRHGPAARQGHGRGVGGHASEPGFSRCS